MTNAGVFSIWLFLFSHFNFVSISCRKSQHTQNQEFPQPPQEELPEEPVLMDTESAEWTSFSADSTEPRYCLCNEISYGDMVACDNPDVSNFN